MNNSKGLSFIEETYCRLLKLHGKQGWWPLCGLKTQKFGTYHPGDYSYPHTLNQCFEVAVGAILTQNTAWGNVERAIKNLEAAHLLAPSSLLLADPDLVRAAIRPAGYFNQKCKKLLCFARFFTSLDGRTPTREELLSLWGIGPETADSILLYAYNKPSFVVDAYTRRIFVALGQINDDASYDEIKRLFEDHLSEQFEIYQEYHALIVAHAKIYYNKKSGSEKDPLLS